jgi:hypothetical protein
MFKSLLFFLLPSLALAFLPSNARQQCSSLSMAPKFDTGLNKWVVSSPDEGPEAGYGPFGSLLRQGPLPFFNRVVKADEYEQAVLKFMAGDQADRKQAQAEMDAYLANPNDWAYNRMQGYKMNYLTLKKKQIALTVVWSVLILSLGARGIYCAQMGENFWTIFGLSSKVADCELYNNCIFDVN